MKTENIYIVGVFILLLALINHAPKNNCLTGPALDAHIAEVLKDGNQ